VAQKTCSASVLKPLDWIVFSILMSYSFSLTYVITFLAVCHRSPITIHDRRSPLCMNLQVNVNMRQWQRSASGPRLLFKWRFTVIKGFIVGFIGLAA